MVAATNRIILGAMLVLGAAAGCQRVQPVDPSTEQAPSPVATPQAKVATEVPALVPIGLELPPPAFRGTPVPVQEPRIEKPLGKPRPERPIGTSGEREPRIPCTVSRRPRQIITLPGNHMPHAATGIAPHMAALPTRTSRPGASEVRCRGMGGLLGLAHSGVRCAAVWCHRSGASARRLRSGTGTRPASIG